MCQRTSRYLANAAASASLNRSRAFGMLLSPQLEDQRGEGGSLLRPAGGAPAGRTRPRMAARPPRHPRRSWPARDGEVVLCGNTFRLVRRWFVKCPICKAPCPPAGCSQPWEEQTHPLRGSTLGGREEGVKATPRPPGHRRFRVRGLAGPRRGRLSQSSSSASGLRRALRAAGLSAAAFPEHPCVRGVASDRTVAYGVHSCRSTCAPGLKGGAPALF